MTPLLISVQWLLGKLDLPGWGFIASNYYRVLCSLLRIRMRVNGEPVRDRAVFFVSNHVSWADILVIGSIAPVAFVAKREVRDWPLVGITAKLQRTVFVDRTRRHQTRESVDRDCQTPCRRNLGGVVRRRHVERWKPRPAVSLGPARRRREAASRPTLAAF